MSALITGVDTLGPWGCGIEKLSEALQSGNCALSEVERGRGLHSMQAARMVGAVDSDCYAEWLDGVVARRMSLSSRMALATARMAVASAGLESSEVGGERTAVSLGNSIGPSGFTVRLLEQIAKHGPQGASPFMFMETVANAYAGQIALYFGARASNSTLAQGEACGALAIARALMQISSGSANRVLAGVVDEIGEVPHALLDRFRALDRGDHTGQERGRVFEEDRCGFVASEGATVLLMEEEQLARQRGAKIFGRVRCAIRAFDPTAPAHNWGTGTEQLSSALLKGLARAGLAPQDFDRIVSSASGSRAGDSLEAGVLQATWGKNPLPPVLTPKAITGEYGGGQLAAAVLALGPQTYAAPHANRVQDPAIAIQPHDGSELPPSKRLLLSSLASGGAACWIVFESCE
jgi:3-oxoacyl-(acyl-carrier-protein) synthase